MDTPTGSAPVETLLENHRAFLRYLERRVGDHALAEDILQDAFAKVPARPEQAPTDEGIVPWFYRALRNAAVDQSRAREALKKRVTESCGTCAEHGCVKCTCKRA